MSDQSVLAVTYDWFFTHESGEEFHYDEVGKQDVVKITYHETAGPGDVHYCDIYFCNGTRLRAFNISTVHFYKEE